VDHTIFFKWLLKLIISFIRLGAGKALVNTRDKVSKQAESDKIGHDALQKLEKDGCPQPPFLSFFTFLPRQVTWL
jgi:hypothetical protein